MSKERRKTKSLKKRQKERLAHRRAKERLRKTLAVGILTFALIALVATQTAPYVRAVENPQTITSQQGRALSVDFDPSLGIPDSDGIKETINNLRYRRGFLEGVGDWLDTYECLTQELEIKKIDADSDPSLFENFPKGQIPDFSAFSDPGRIHIVHSNDVPPLITLRNYGVHESGHACKPTEPRIFDQPIYFPDRDDIAEVYGVHGLVLLTRSSDGTDSKFNLFEEAMVEAMANHIDGYKVSNSRYHALGSYIRQTFPDAQPHELQAYLDEQDVLGFIEDFHYNLSPQDRPWYWQDPQDLLGAMNTFQSIWNNS